MNLDSSHSYDGSPQHLDVAVVGGGQAGLAIGHYLRQQGCRFVILERASELAPAWRERWDSLTLFTARRYSALPGLPFPGDPDGYPTRDEVISYLERYAKTFELPIELNSPVEQLDQGDDGRFRLAVGGRMFIADQVVVATGPFQTPYVPKLNEKLADDLFRTHAVGYRKPGDVPKAPCSWSAAAIRAFRSRRSSRRRARSCSRSGRNKSRCPSACSGATSSGG